MNDEEIVRFVEENLANVHSITVDGTTFCFVGEDRKMPFVTLVRNDQHDQASNLNRDGVFRLNIGIEPDSYRRMFGQQPSFRTDGKPVETGHDFTALDQVMPHPIYAAMSWVCVLNPSEGTFDKVKPLIADARELAARRNRTPTP